MDEHGIQEFTSKCMQLERNVNAHLHRAVDQKNRETFKQMKDEIIFLEKKVAALKKKSDKYECRICQDRDVDVTVNDCGHMMCFDCFTEISSKEPQKCPFCRAIIDTYQRMYII